ncbi:conserved hypothetical protein [Sphingomonas aurantiaca]|jgi:hypothetical protein|uniref:DUF2474 domain-containing protein n=1 Tax=Sphingomonas aurantiaca TaxID=185949 RepID=A0A5E7XT30_9SPHN|nr:MULTISPECIES: DUF2474 domain-containing protein [Sphingomonas]MCP8893089.1 DUF2474 domain-containing protein [Sphingomonas faeni]VVS96293.1 conserved hypothetical protein [Sphingomonas aurantiaca]
MADTPPASLWRRIGWLVLIWTLSVLALGIVASIIRWWLHP